MCVCVPHIAMRIAYYVTIFPYFPFAIAHFKSGAASAKLRSRQRQFSMNTPLPDTGDIRQNKLRLIMKNYFDNWNLAMRGTGGSEDGGRGTGKTKWPRNMDKYRVRSAFWHTHEQWTMIAFRSIWPGELNSCGNATKSRSNRHSYNAFRIQTGIGGGSDLSINMPGSKMLHLSFSGIAFGLGEEHKFLIYSHISLAPIFHGTVRFFRCFIPSFRSLCFLLDAS